MSHGFEIVAIAQTLNSFP